LSVIDVVFSLTVQSIYFLAIENCFSLAIEKIYFLAIKKYVKQNQIRLLMILNKQKSPCKMVTAQLYYKETSGETARR